MNQLLQSDMHSTKSKCMSESRSWGCTTGNVSRRRLEQKAGCKNRSKGHVGVIGCRNVGKKASPPESLLAGIPALP